MKIKNNFFLLLFFAGLLQILAYYVAAATVRSDGEFSIAQPDTLLYCQAARRIVEGHPFSFSEGAAVSTGTTSVLYPFILAIPMTLGVHGESLFLVGFLLNAVFYLLFLFGWGVVIREKCDDGFPMFLGASLIALSGQAAFCAMAASDTGLWMAASALIAAGLVTKRKWLYFPLLVLAPWMRPEGVMLALSLLTFSVIALLYGKRGAREVLLSSSFAVFSTFGVFALNFWISGHFGFSSVANKSRFCFMPFSDSVLLILADFVKILKTLFLGLPVSKPRDFQIVPVLGAAFLWLGVFTRDWRREGWWKEAGWLLAGLLSILSVSYGGCEGENMDRYLAWFLPTMFVFVSDGVGWFAKHLETPSARIAPALLLVLYATMSAVAGVMSFSIASSRSDMMRSFASVCENKLPPKASLGVFEGCGIAYQMSPRMIRHLMGIYSPEFSIGYSANVLEVLKNEPCNRFDYWYLNSEEDKKYLYSSGRPDLDAYGKIVLMGPQGREVRKADWAIFDAASLIPSPNIARYKHVARVDVGYDPDEKRASYEPLTVFDQQFPLPFLQVATKDDGTKIIEAGRLLLGGDEMTVELKPGCDVEVVMRTLSKVHAVAYDAFGVSAGGDCSFKSPMELFVTVDDESVGKVSFEIRDEGFTDAHFTIPGSAIKQTPCRIGFHGEHVACCYWFYQ